MVDWLLIAWDMTGVSGVS